MNVFVYNLQEISVILKNIIPTIKPYDIIIVEGDPGVGKSTLIYKIIDIIENNKFITQSPTFTKVHEYPSIIHMDLYYCDNIQLYRDYFNSEKIIFIEWGHWFSEIPWTQWWTIKTLPNNKRQLTIKFNK